MACATLKRHIDWEPVLGVRPSKRRRCNPVCSSSDRNTSPRTAYRSPRPSTSTDICVTPSSSPFANVSCPNITPESMAARLREEIRRLHRRKQLHYNANTERMQDTSSEGSSSGSEAQGPEVTPSRSEKALFTFKQVGMICERMLRERENLLREEYDQVLTAKLAEQYDAFVKFTYDQIQKRYEAVPSYLS